jgi:beta-galactosidase
VEFDGVFRDARVWVNGHYLGHEPSGYHGFGWNLSEFLNYGGNNVIVVRADATMEEGWFYEGAGIYRHAWLVKTDPLHVARHGTFVSSEVKAGSADVTARVTVINERTASAPFEVEQTILDPDGKTVAAKQLTRLLLGAGDSGEFTAVLNVAQPRLWSIETPHLHRLITTVLADGKAVDRCETPFGIRSIRFDPDQGFFLNGKRVQLKGLNMHQDHAGVGAAIPDALQEFRIARLKAFGANAYRCSHNPPTPELLDACDRLGMLVIDEQRLMGTSEDQLDELKRLIQRDRNHPSVILWCLGNEEWRIEGNVTGERITAAMQAFAHRLDPTRPCTVASSGGWENGSLRPVQVMGFNYISHGNTDEQHRKFPQQSGVGTEETSTQQTRGIYFDDRERGHLAPLEKGDSGGNCEIGWKHYAARPYLAGLFYWTGFDYRGEPTPFGWPAVSSQFGILDSCGFPKDSFYYLKSWWTDEPVLHVFPHWNWPGREGQEIEVRAHSNCEEVELLLNGQSQGRKPMEKNGHLAWKVKYQPGTLLARGFKGGKEISTARVATTGGPDALQLAALRASINADQEDVAVIAVQILDAQGRLVPVAGNEVAFGLQGPGRIIGVGNGDPSSHEPDVFIAQRPVRIRAVTGWKWSPVSNARQPDLPEAGAAFDVSGWKACDVNADNGSLGQQQSGVFRATIAVTGEDEAAEFVRLSFGSIDDDGWICVNGKKVGETHDWKASPTFDLKPFLHAGDNTVAVAVVNQYGGGGLSKGVTLIVESKPELPVWKRSAFNGLAQVIVQSAGPPGDITLRAISPGLKPAVLKIEARSAPQRPAVPE